MHMVSPSDVREGSDGAPIVRGGTLMRTLMKGEGDSNGDFFLWPTNICVALILKSLENPSLELSGIFGSSIPGSVLQQAVPSSLIWVLW